MAQALLLISLLCFTAIAMVGASEEDALLQIRQQFGNPSSLSSWNSTINGSPCSNGLWRGVTCGIDSTSVVSLSLRRVNLAGGSLSPAIGDLPNLQSLDLSQTRLIGLIPPEINKLASLLQLDLSGNSFTGDLPKKWSNLMKLANLTLTNNQLTGAIPDGLSGATSLSRLKLDGNKLSGAIPPELFILRMKLFSIAYNDISGPIPKEIGECVSLRSFYASNNRLNGSIPDSFGSLSNLLHFEVEVNELSEALPDSLNHVTDTLKTFNVSYNRLAGPVPTNLSAKFNASSFLGNPSLCGTPPFDSCSSSPAPGQSLPPPAPYHHESSDEYHQNYDRKSSSRQTAIIICVVIGAAIASLILLCLLFLLFRKLKKSKSRDSSQVQNWFSPDIQANRRKGSYEVYQRGFQYSYEEIVTNAGYFDTAHVVGKGRFATVYRSLLPDGTHMAIKVFKFANVPPTFEREIEMLASIKHRNILSYKGFYTNPVEKAIFYDYIPTGSLYDLLHGGRVNMPNTPPVLPDWTARHTIALGVAQAMAFLHRGCGYRIIHKDLKSTNILLETDMTPRVSDYGLVHMVSGKPWEPVVETEGYTAPEVLTSKKCTEKSDVYSYGVILMELITGQKAVSYERERALSLTNWVTRLHTEKRGREVMDAVALKTCPLPMFLDRALDLAVLCVNADPNHRPSMAEIVSVLESLMSSPSPLRSPETRLDMPLLYTHH